ncbi:hypothetical protein T492DRAFT_864996 [Pavlovales sp. CCMP2436]|nr:hypothetical protein T492DRAFT_864996 [Pavlovales sp. CCMP2436]
MSASLSSVVSHSALTFELIGPLLTILCPTLRPFQFKLMTAEEQKAVTDVVDTMIATVPNV